MKERLPHGQFLVWIDAKFGMSKSAAYRFMNVAEVYAPKLPIVGSLEPAALYELAAPTTPLEVREEVERMVEAGEIVTKATVEELSARLAGVGIDIGHDVGPTLADDAYLLA